MEILFYEGLSKGKIVFDRIAKLQNQIISSKDDKINIHIMTDGRIGRTFIFLLGCLPLLANQYGKNITLFFAEGTTEHVKTLDIFSFYRQDTKMQRFRRINNHKDIIKLVTEIINEAPVDFDDELYEKMVSRIGEMYNNAIGHSRAKHVIGGKYFKSTNGQRSKYCFSCYDTGIGIACGVQKFFQDKGNNISEADALAWAIKYGNSTAIGSRGLGMTLLHNFARINHGTIRICTGNTLYTYNENTGGKYKAIKNHFYGTLIEMDIIANNKSIYILKKE